MLKHSPGLHEVLRKSRLADLNDRDRKLIFDEYTTRRRRILELEVEAAALRTAEPLLRDHHDRLLKSVSPQAPTATERRSMPVAAVPAIRDANLRSGTPPDGWEMLLPWTEGTPTWRRATTPPAGHLANWSKADPSRGEISIAVGAGCFRGCPSDPPDYLDSCYSYQNEYEWLFGRGSSVSAGLWTLRQFPFGPLSRRTRLDVTSTVTAWSENRYPDYLEPHARYDIGGAIGAATLIVAGAMPEGRVSQPSYFRFLDSWRRGDSASNSMAIRQFDVRNSTVLEAGADYLLILLAIDLFALYTWPSTEPGCEDPGLALIDMGDGEDHLSMISWGNGPMRVGPPHIVMSPA